MKAKRIQQAVAVALGWWLVNLISGAPSAAPTQARTYAIVAAQSTFTIFAGKAGFLSVFGHDHTIAVKSFSGRVQVPAAGVSQASLELEVEAGSLAVVDKGISDKERAEIQKAMETEVLEVARFPKISFRSASVANIKPAGSNQSFALNGDLTLHGVTKRIAVPVVATIAPEQLRATGQVTIRQTDFGIKPYSAAGGTIKVKNELKLNFSILARAS